MNIANVIVTVVLVYYTIYIIDILFNRNMRYNIQKSNIKLDELRTIPKKSLKEQRDFINLRYPKRKGKFNWKSFLRLKSILTIFLKILMFLIIFRFYMFILTSLNIELMLWHAIAFGILFPTLLNFILKKFNVHKNDISVFFKWR